MTDKEVEKLYTCILISDNPNLGDSDSEATKGICSECERGIWHKSWAPTSMPKICYKCAIEKIVEMAPDEEFVVLPGRMARPH